MLSCQRRDSAIRIELAIATPSVANLREHWAKRAKRARDQREQAFFGLWNGSRGRYMGRDAKMAHVIKLTRVSPRKLDDDNLRGALKAIRDGVASALGFRDDSDPTLTWEYAQEKGKPAVRIEVDEK
jgi:hypothetical protein